MFCLNGQTFSSLTGRTSGLPYDQLEAKFGICHACSTRPEIHGQKASGTHGLPSLEELFEEPGQGRVVL
jgi:hypothetical protein